MRIVMTGGAGYIGSALVKSLLDEGDEVASIDNLTRGDYRYLKKLDAGRRLELIVGDIRQPSLLEQAFKDADAVAHLAALPGLTLCNKRPEEAISVNVYGTAQVLECARRLEVERVVFCSSAAVYGKPVYMPVDELHQLRPINLYGVTKLAGEKLMEAYHENYGLEAVNLRFGNVYGVGLFTNWETVIPRFVKQGLEGEPLTIYGDGDSSRDFVHVYDIVKAIALALKVQGVGGEAFNVGGEVLKIGVLAGIVSDELQKVTGRRSSVIHLAPRPGETREFSYRKDKIERTLGYRARWGVREGIRQLIEYKLGYK